MFFDFLKYPMKIGEKNFNEWIEQNLYNRNFVQEKLVFPEAEINYPEPNYLINENIPTEFKAKTEIIPPMFVRKFKNGKCYTKNGLILTHDNVPLTDYTPLETHPLKNKRHYKFRNPEKIKGSIVVLTNDSCQKNYYHWLIENASRLHLIEKSGFKIDKYLINNECAYQKRILSLLGIPEEKILNLEPNRLIQADYLIVPSIINYFEEIRTPNRNYYNAKFIPEWTIKFYREKFLPLVKQTEPKKIYISRSKAPYRKVENEEEIVNYIKNFGFESYCLEDYDFLEQVELFHNAEIIISAHGAGLTTLMFCKAGTKVIEVFSPNYFYIGQQIIALTLDLNYSYFVAKETYENYSGFAPIIIDKDILNKVLFKENNGK